MKLAEKEKMLRDRAAFLEKRIADIEKAVEKKDYSNLHWERDLSEAREKLYEIYAVLTVVTSCKDKAKAKANRVVNKFLFKKLN